MCLALMLGNIANIMQELLRSKSYAAAAQSHRLLCLHQRVVTTRLVLHTLSALRPVLGTTSSVAAAA
jgi:hypothetical protein